jgi:hypothetical protein
MNCTCSLTVQKILQGILLVAGLDDSPCKGERIGQCLTLLVGQVEGQGMYVDASLERLVTVASQMSHLAAVETLVVLLEGIDIHQGATTTMDDTSGYLLVPRWDGGVCSQCNLHGCT